MAMNKILLSLAAALAIFFTACAQKKEKQSMDNNSSKTLVAYFSAYNPQNEMFSHFGTKRYNFKNETQLFKVIPHTSKNQKKSTGFAGTKYI